MKPFYSKEFSLALAALTFSAISVMAQPTIDLSNFSPTIGEQLVNQLTSYQSVSATGAEQVYDFTTIDLLQEVAIDVVDPNSTVFGEGFPLADIAYQNANGVEYYALNEDGFYNVGQVIGADPFSATDLQLVYPLPLTLGTMATDTGVFVGSQMGFDILQTNVITIEAVGFGELRLYNDTIPEVLHVRSTTQVESVTDPGGMSETTQEFTFVQDAFLAPFADFPVIQMVDVLLNGQSAQQYGILYQSWNFNTLDEADLNISIDAFPNPVTDILTIRVEHQEQKSAEVQLFDTKGQAASTPVLIGPDGLREIPMSELATGIYILRVSTDEGATSKYIVKE